MIEVRWFCHKTEVELTLDGHAGYNPGNDIVCAAASMLAETFAQVLLNMEYRGDLSTFHMDPLGKGHMYVYGKAIGLIPSIKQQMALKTVWTGFDLLRKKYPDHVKLIRNDTLKGVVSDENGS